MRVAARMVVPAAIIPRPNLAAVNLAGVEARDQILFAFRVRATRHTSHREMTPLSSGSFSFVGVVVVVVANQAHVRIQIIIVDQPQANKGQSHRLLLLLRLFLMQFNSHG